MRKEIGLFKVRSANESLKDAEKLEPPKELYKSLIYEGEITILMADTNVGKSIFIVQIANDIAASQNVLYIDLELSDKQFERRYSDNFKNHFVFNEKLSRVNFSSCFEIPNGNTYEEYFLESLVGLIKACDAKVVIIDNMTKLTTTDTDSAQRAKPIMDNLCALKIKYGLTMILLEHTRKINTSRAVTLNDLQGSKMKANFADSVFTIGRSSDDSNMRYIKQLKVRSSELEYDADNIILYELNKNVNFLNFRLVGYGAEYQCLRQSDDTDREERVKQAKELKNKGMSNRKIAIELGVSEGSIRKWLKKNII